MQARQGLRAGDCKNLGREFLLTLDDAMPEDEKLPREEDGSVSTLAPRRPDARLRGRRSSRASISTRRNSCSTSSRCCWVSRRRTRTARCRVRGRCLRSTPVITAPSRFTWIGRRLRSGGRWLTHWWRRWMTRGFIKASFWQLGSDTGRMTCSEPNLLQIPRDESFRGVWSLQRVGCFSTLTTARWSCA